MKRTKVKDQPLERDNNSKAILNSDKTAYTLHCARKKRLLNQKNEIENLSSELKSLKAELESIRSLINKN